MDVQEADFLQEIDEKPLKNNDNEDKELMHPDTGKSSRSRDFDGKPIQDAHYNSHYFVHEETGIKVEDQGKVWSTFEGVQYAHDLCTEEHLVEPEFVVPEELYIKLEGEGRGQPNTNKCNEKPIKEECFIESKITVQEELDIKDDQIIKEQHFVESKIFVTEELDIKDEDEGEDQFTVMSPIDQISNRTDTIDGISTNNHLTEPPVFKCLNCTYQTHRKLNMASHILNHMEKTLKCSHCSYKTSNKWIFKQHELIHVPKEQVKLHQCPECSFTSIRKGDISQHKITHKKPDDVNWYQCPECPYKTKRKAHLTHQHMLIHKKDVPMHKCTLCCYETSRNSDLTKHLQRVHRPKDDIQLIHCPEEGCSFKTHHESYLARHISRRHECKKVFTCSKCSYETKYPYALRAHELGHEDRDKWFSCSLCPYKGTSTKSLKWHMLVHKSGSEVKWFHCSDCSFKTKHRNSFRYHKLNHSLNPEKVFKCSECSYETSRAQNFRAHHLVHKKPEEISEWFYCYLCTLRTPRKNNLATHIRKKHRDSNGRINDRTSVK